MAVSGTQITTLTPMGVMGRPYSFSAKTEYVPILWVATGGASGVWSNPSEASGTWVGRSGADTTWKKTSDT